VFFPVRVLTGTRLIGAIDAVVEAKEVG